MTTASLPSNEFETQALSTAGAKLYLNEESADFHFICKSHDGELKRIPAHKLLLIAVSDVFRAMFNGSWIEKNEVEIVDASAEAFEEFLQFFYLNKVKLTMANAAEVMNLGNKYDVPECFNISAKYLKNNITADNVCQGLELAIRLEHNELRRLCETIIGLDTKAALASDCFLKCEKSTVKHILLLNTLNCSEADIFEAMMKWTKVQSKRDVLTRENIQEHFGDLLQEIRFGLMTLQEFVSVDPKNIFTNDEYSEIIQVIASSEYQSQMFTHNRKKRGENVFNAFNPSITCNRLISNCYSAVPYYLKSTESTTLSVNEHVWLTSIRTDVLFEYGNNQYVNYDPVVTFPSKMTIIETADLSQSDAKTVVLSQIINISSKSSSIDSLPKPIMIKPGFKYEIRMEQTPPEKCCIGRLLKSTVQIKPGIVVQFHNDPTVRGDAVSRGSIVYLNFKTI